MNPETIARIYPLDVWLPAGLVLSSVALFAARGLGVAAGQRMRGTAAFDQPARRASTSNAGKVLPSSTSRNAPPPVEM